jgi:hypothetical protein
VERRIQRGHAGMNTQDFKRSCLDECTRIGSTL